MILFKEITQKNCQEFAGLPANIMVAEHKQGPVKLKHSFCLIGIVVCEIDQKEGRYFYVQFSNGNSSGVYNSVFELLEKESGVFSFYYVEIKKNHDKNPG